MCDKGFIFNPSNCKCECGKCYDIGEYLDYSKCKCRKKFVDPLIEQCAVNFEETKLVNITVGNENNGRCNSYVVYKVLFCIFFIISRGIGIYFVYHNHVDMLIIITIIYLIIHI